MSDDSTDQTVNPEAEQAEAATEEEADKKVLPGGRRQNLLSKSTDFIERPGFRNPANVRSKASKKDRRKKKR